MILHVDMDAFYASIEERDRPELAGKPVIVGGAAEGRGVVAAANYTARKFGVHSAMPAATAKRLCPNAVFLPSRIGYYSGVSAEIRAIFHRYTPLVEPLSLDEAFLDVRGSEPLFGPPVEIGRKIKQEIWDRLRLVASVGVAPNKFLAKIASDLEKPNGFVIVDPNQVQAFLDPLPVARLWGVGAAARQVFQKLGVRTIGQMRKLSADELHRHFRNQGDHFWRLAHGVDDRKVVPDREAKSISHETTFAKDVEDMNVLRTWLMELTEQVAWRLRRKKLQGRTVHLKLRYSDFFTITRSRTLPNPTDVTQEIWHAAAEMLSRRLPTRRLCVRLIGVGVSGFESPAQVQQTLFTDSAHDLLSCVDDVADQIRARYGQRSLRRAAGMIPEADAGSPHDKGDGKSQRRESNP